MRDQKGFTLVEVLVAVAIIAMVVTPFIGLVMKGHFFTTDARLRSEAAFHAQEKMEHMLTLANPITTDWAQDAGQPFEWRVLVNQGAGQPVTVGTKTLDVIVVQVRWNTKNGVQSFEVTTYGKPK